MANNHIEKVAIVGAGGKIGNHLTAALLSTGKHKVTAIARPNSTNKLPSGVEFKYVDYTTNEDETANALRGQQALIPTMSVSAPRDTTLKLVRAAAQAGVPYIFPNWFGHDAANKRLCDDSLLTSMLEQTVGEVRRLGVSRYILLNCNFWYEFSLAGGPDRFGFDFEKRTLAMLNGGNVPINTSTWTQCGRAVASLLSMKVDGDNEDGSTSLSQFLDKGVYISSFRLTQRDVFESVKRVMNTTENDWTITHESAEKRWEEGRARIHRGDYSAFTRMLYTRMFFANGDGDYERGNIDNQVLGLPVEDLDAATAAAVGMAESKEVAFSH